MEEVVKGMSEGGEKERTGGEDVSQLIQALKEAVMELRETVTELTNPLNKLESRSDAEISSIHRSLNRKVEMIPINSNKSVESIEPANKEGLSTDNNISRKSNEELSKIIEEDKLILAPTISRARRRGVQKILRLMKALFSLRNRVPPSILERYIDVFAKLGMISSDDAGIAKELLKAIEEGYSKGLGVEDQILLLTLLAKGLGITDESLEEETLGIIANIIGRQHHAVTRTSKSGNGPKTPEEGVSMDKVG